MSFVRVIKNFIMFQYTVGYYKPEYATYEQQDSHEFLTFLMDWLHNDLNMVPYIFGVAKILKRNFSCSNVYFRFVVQRQLKT